MYHVRITEHKEKIRRQKLLPNPDENRIRHWLTEIETFRREVKKAEERLRMPKK